MQLFLEALHRTRRVSLHPVLERADRLAILILLLLDLAVELRLFGFLLLEHLLSAVRAFIQICDFSSHVISAIADKLLEFSVGLFKFFVDAFFHLSEHAKVVDF